MRNPQSIACEVGSFHFQDKLYNSDSLLIILVSLFHDTVTDYSLIMSLCMKLDPGIHIVMHSVLFLKPGVTPLLLAEFKRLCNILAASTNRRRERGPLCLTPLL